MLRKNREEGKRRRFLKEIAFRSSLYMKVPLQEPLHEKILLFRSNNWSSQYLELSFCLRNKDYTMIAYILYEIVFNPPKIKVLSIFLVQYHSAFTSRKNGDLYASLYPPFSLLSLLIFLSSLFSVLSHCAAQASENFSSCLGLHVMESQMCYHARHKFFC